MAKRHVYIESSGGRAAYAQVLKRITKDNVCPFCMPNFLKYHTRPIVRHGAHWLVTENMNPYRGSKRHILFVHKKHIKSPEKMSLAAWRELLGHVAWTNKKYKLTGSAFFMRMGDPRYTG
ncbi:MAG: hypothetical protein KGI70_03480, partial [Patescibacteria group bacterium]|nr:hypothetical protein [Patescibacteria group bacterium]